MSHERAREWLEQTGKWGTLEAILDRHAAHVLRELAGRSAYLGNAQTADWLRAEAEKLERGE